MTCLTGVAVGMSVNEFNEQKDLEVMTFRRNILTACQDTITERDEQGAHKRALYVYAPDVHSTPDLPPNLAKKIDGGRDMFRHRWPEVSLLVSKSLTYFKFLDIYFTERG